MSIENKIKLLWDCASTLVGNGHAHKLLKSHYINTCRNLARNSIQIPKEKFAISQMCPHCGCFWSESEFSLKLKSQRVSNNAKTCQLIENLDKSKDPANRKLLSKKQRNRARWLKKRVTNYMEINCRLCKQKSVVKMEKLKNKTENTADKKIKLINCGDNVVENAAKPKNIKKKSKTAGLKIPEIINTKEQRKETKLTTVSATKHTEKLLPKPHNSNVNGNQLQKKQISKLNSKQKNKSVTTTAPTSNKVISKTQKHNSLLQLAALLKNQSSISDVKTSTQKKLESLLK